MSYILTHHKRDGTVERKVQSLDQSVSPERRERDMKEGIAMIRQAAKGTRGWNKKKTMRLVARIPAEIIDHVRLNEGREAAADTRHVLRRAAELGIDCRVTRGRI